VTTLKSLFVTALLFVVAVSAVPAAAQVEIPEEWLGIWELDLASYDCETDDLLFATTSFDTICPGNVFEEPDPEDIPIECTGSADGSSYSLHCEGSEVIQPGCSANFVYDATGTRNGESYTSVAIVNISFTGDCPLIPDSCQRIEITGTRIGSAPEPCGQTPVESWTWNTVRSLYR
jgi:hypothetical protein